MGGRRAAVRAIPRLFCLPRFPYYRFGLTLVRAETPLRIPFLAFGNPLPAARADSGPHCSTTARLPAVGTFGLFLESTQRRLSISSGQPINCRESIYKTANRAARSPIRLRVVAWLTYGAICRSSGLLALTFSFSQQCQRTPVFGETMIVRSDSSIAMTQCVSFPDVFSCSRAVCISL